MTIPDYDLRADHTPPPEQTLALLTTQRALVARARIRDEIAMQDRRLGEKSMWERNTRVAQDQLARVLGP